MVSYLFYQSYVVWWNGDTPSVNLGGTYEDKIEYTPNLNLSIKVLVTHIVSMCDMYEGVRVIARPGPSYPCTCLDHQGPGILGTYMYHFLQCETISDISGYFVHDLLPSLSNGPGT